MKPLVWLASYPRSGNTWLRVFLTNLIDPSLQGAPINELLPAPIISSSQFLESTLCYDVDCLTPSEAKKLIPLAIRWHAQRSANPSFHKIHDLRTEVLVPADYTRLIIYIIRNPLDVCVSYSHFLGESNLDRTVELISNPKQHISIKQNAFPTLFPQFISSWSKHVESWTQDHEIPILTLRYEDMLKAPVPSFSRIAKALNIPHDSSTISAAIDASAFNKIQDMEDQHGFAERPAHAKRFFKSGKYGSWRSCLSEAQAAKIIDSNREYMNKFAYLDLNGRPIF